MHFDPPASLSRRRFLASVGAATTLAGFSRAPAAESAAETFPKRPGRLKQGVCRGVFRGV